MLLLFATNTCDALGPFKKAFDKAYVKSTDDAAFKARFKKASCNTCHVKGKKKDWLNGYGLELAKRIPDNAKERLEKAKSTGADAKKAENEKLLKELRKAFNQTESAKTASGELFGRLLKEHRLPPPSGALSIRAAETKSTGTADTR